MAIKEKDNSVPHIQSRTGPIGEGVRDEGISFQSPLGGQSAAGQAQAFVVLNKLLVR